MCVQVDLHGLHVEEALQVLEQHLLTLGGLGCPGGVLLQVRWASCMGFECLTDDLYYKYVHKVGLGVGSRARSCLNMFYPQHNSLQAAHGQPICHM